MIDQAHSDLRPRIHREACKRRMKNGEGGAGRDGRRYLLTREAVREELARGARSPAPRPAAKEAPPKSRARDLGDFEREVMSGLRAVKDGGR